MKFLASTIERLEKMRPVVLAELHPNLRDLVEQVLSETGGLFTPYCGYRDEKGQASWTLLAEVRAIAR